MFNSDYKLGCDAHKHLSLFAIRGPSGQILDRVRINHYPGAIQAFLAQFPDGTPVALETVGNWYWIVNAAKQRRGMKPQAASPCSHTPTSPKK